MRKNLTKKGRLQKILKNSLRMKKRFNWSRETGAGFIQADIIDVDVDDSNILYLTLYDAQAPHHLVCTVQDLNLRETEELLNWVKGNL